MSQAGHSVQGRTGCTGPAFSLLLSGCNHSAGTSGQRKDLPVDQWAVQSRDQGECPPRAQQEEGVCTWPGSHALALLWHHSGPAAGELMQCVPQVLGYMWWSHGKVASEALWHFCCWCNVRQKLTSFYKQRTWQFMLYLYFHPCHC